MTKIIKHPEVHEKFKKELLEKFPKSIIEELARQINKHY